MIKIALFAACQVGHRIAKFFGEKDEPLSCLVLDIEDTEGLNAAIADSSRVPHERLFTSNRIYDEETLEALKKLDLDLIILAWWPYILKEQIIEIPRLGCLNFHPSYLPFNRGKHYNFWSLVEDVPFGVTLHFIDRGVDSGEIAYQKVIEKSWEDTGKTLYDKAQEEIVQLFIESFEQIKTGNIPKTKQDLSRGSYHRSEELDSASRIHLDQQYPARDLLNLIRARTFPPYPGAWFVEGGQKYEVRLEIKKA